MNALLEQVAESGWEAVFGRVSSLAEDPGNGESLIDGVTVLETAGVNVSEEFRTLEPIREAFLVVAREEVWQAKLASLSSPPVPSDTLGLWGVWSVGVPLDKGLVVHVPSENLPAPSVLLYSHMGDREGRLRLALDDQGRIVRGRFEADLHCHRRQCENDKQCDEPCGQCRCVPVIERVRNDVLRGTACRCDGH